MVLVSTVSVTTTLVQNNSGSLKKVVMGLYASSTQPVQIADVDPFVPMGIVELEPALGLVGA